MGEPRGPHGLRCDLCQQLLPPGSVPCILDPSDMEQGGSTPAEDLSSSGVGRQGKPLCTCCSWDCVRRWNAKFTPPFLRDRWDATIASYEAVRREESSVQTQKIDV